MRHGAACSIRRIAWAAGGEAEGEHASLVLSSHVPDAGRGAPGRETFGHGAPGGRDVYVYFDNDAKVRAPVDAQGLMERVRRGPG
jgi:uncharacterized protein YecE (DUF72 family)